MFLYRRFIGTRGINNPYMDPDFLGLKGPHYMSDMTTVPTSQREEDGFGNLELGECPGNLPGEYGGPVVLQDREILVAQQDVKCVHS